MKSLQPFPQGEVSSENTLQMQDYRKPQLRLPKYPLAGCKLEETPSVTVHQRHFM